MEDFKTKNVTGIFMFFVVFSVLILNTISSLDFIFQKLDHRGDPVHISGNISVETRVAPTPVKLEDRKQEYFQAGHLPLPTADDAHDRVSVLMGTHQRASRVLL